MARLSLSRRAIRPLSLLLICFLFQDAKLASGNPQDQGENQAPASSPQLEREAMAALRRIPELTTLFRLAEAEGVEAFLYGGTSRSLLFHVREKLINQEAVLPAREMSIPLEQIVGPHSDIDIIIRGSPDAAQRIEERLRSLFPEGERFHRWDVRTEEYLQEPWQHTQGYEAISKVLLGSRGWEEPEWRRASFGESLTESGAAEVVSGRITYERNPRYAQSQPYRDGKHHELLEALAYLRHLDELPGVTFDETSMKSVRAILQQARKERELNRFMANPVFRARLSWYLQKLQATSRNNLRTWQRMRELGILDLASGLEGDLPSHGAYSFLREPLGETPRKGGGKGKRLGKRLSVYHGTKGYAQAWSIHRGGPFITSHSRPPSFFAALHPKLARFYANGNPDYVLKITVSPDAREGEDFIWEEEGAVIRILNRGIIESIDRPLSTPEVKARLLAALARPSGKASSEEQRHLQELATRAQRKNSDAMLALAGLVWSAPSPGSRLSRSIQKKFWGLDLGRSYPLKAFADHEDALFRLPEGLLLPLLRTLRIGLEQGRSALSAAELNELVQHFKPWTPPRYASLVKRFFGGERLLSQRGVRALLDRIQVTIDEESPLSTTLLEELVRLLPMMDPWGRAMRRFVPHLLGQPGLSRLSPEGQDRLVSALTTILGGGKLASLASYGSFADFTPQVQSRLWKLCHAQSLLHAILVNPELGRLEAFHPRVFAGVRRMDYFWSKYGLYKSAIGNPSLSSCKPSLLRPLARDVLSLDPRLLVEWAQNPSFPTLDRTVLSEIQTGIEGLPKRSRSQILSALDRTPGLLDRLSACSDARLSKISLPVAPPRNASRRIRR